MACFRQCSTAFSSVFPSRSSTSQEDQSEHHAAEAKVLSTCACAGVCCIGITADRVLFQPVGTSISIPLAEFRDAEKAIALIRQKLAEVQR
jgi:hypothetical protein